MFANENKQSQINVLRNFLYAMEQDSSENSLMEDLERLINSKSPDLQELRQRPVLSVFDRNDEVPVLVRKIAHEAMSDALDSLKVRPSSEEYNKASKVFSEQFESLIYHPEDCEFIRFCDECDKVMSSGYVIDGGSEHYCSDECLHKNYSEDEYLVMCCNLNPDDPEDLATCKNATPDELEEMIGGGDTYFTEWED